ncbi:MAG: tetratricopeptide repeat protein [Candidatus Sumerlaeaceae bacterium]|jgi:tetratricopeptide (TPR) repeat protein
MGPKQPRRRKAKNPETLSVATSITPRVHLLVYSIVAMVAFVAFLPAVQNGFTNWDDNVNLTDNPFLRPPSWWGFQQLWLAPYENLYVPLFYVSYYLDLFLSGGRPLGFVTHAVNLVLHASASALAAYVLRQLWTHSDHLELRNLAVSPAFLFCWTAGALIFAVHPIQTEVVAWATGRKDLLAALLVLASWSLLWRARESLQPAKAWFHRAAFVFFVASLFAKPASVALPLALVATDWILERPQWSVMFRRYAWWFAAAILWVIATAGTQDISAQAKAQLTPSWMRPFVATDALLFYVQKIIWPFNFAAAYGHTPLAASQTSLFWFSLPIVVVALVFFLRRSTVWATATMIFLVFVSPVLGLLPFAFQRFSTVADRYVYLSMIGVGCAVSAGLWRIVGKWPARLSVTASLTALLGIALIALSWRQARVWRDSVTLWEHNIRVAPRSAVAFANLAAAYALQNRTDDAIAANKRALELDPVQERAHSNLGLLLVWRGETTAALAHLRRAIELRPNFAAPYAHLGDVYLKQNKLREAAEAYRAALDRDARDVKAILGLSYCYFCRGRLAEAEQLLQDGLVARPDNPLLWISYGHFLSESGRKHEAVRMFQRALELDPENAEARQRLKALEEKLAQDPSARQ